MKYTPRITMHRIVPVLSISPMEEDHFFLQNILNRRKARWMLPQFPKPVMLQ
jgi:hypothetical protein